jgi:tetratricopeptide (TPR) repeat protein
MMRSSLSLLLALTCASTAHASGADDLMRATGQVAAPSAQTAQSGPSIIDPSSFVLKDPFAVQLFSRWQTLGQTAGQTGHTLPFDVNSWTQQVLKGNYAQAAHLWTMIQPQVPQTFANAAYAAQIYCLWKLNLSQTFFNEWLNAIHSPEFRQDSAAVALGQTAAVGFDHWILDHAIVLTPDQRSFIATLDPQHGYTPDFMITTVRGYAALRTGAAAEPLLATLSPENALKLPLSQTVTLAFARTGDLSGAARIVKDHLEPALQAKNDPKLVAENYIQIARLLYQAGSLDGAEQYYQKVLTGVPSYMSSREELMWVWLRKGDTSRLRGELESLKSPIFADRFSPELYLVRAISNLKLCFYDDVAKDFQGFVVSNSKWVKEISDAEKAQNPPPPERDFYTLLLERSYNNLSTENSALDKLGEESISAALPAVGWQRHWKQARDNVASLLADVKRQRSDEYRRQWRNRQQILAEAIRKMRFVKVEYLSQLHTMAEAGRDQISTTSAAPIESPAEVKEEKKKVAQDGDMTFPFDGTYWPDEVFKLRSIVHGQCLK